MSEYDPMADSASMIGKFGILKFVQSRWTNFSSQNKENVTAVKMYESLERTDKHEGRVHLRH